MKLLYIAKPSMKRLIANEIAACYENHCYLMLGATLHVSANSYSQSVTISAKRITTKSLQADRKPDDFSFYGMSACWISRAGSASM